jgi:hypothetical protein
MLCRKRFWELGRATRGSDDVIRERRATALTRIGDLSSLNAALMVEAMLRRDVEGELEGVEMVVGMKWE